MKDGKQIVEILRNLADKIERGEVSDIDFNQINHLAETEPQNGCRTYEKAGEQTIFLNYRISQYLGISPLAEIGSKRIVRAVVEAMQKADRRG